MTTKDNLHYQVTIDGSACLGEGCLVDENIVAVVLPQKFKVTKYQASVPGDWKANLELILIVQDKDKTFKGFLGIL